MRNILLIVTLGVFLGCAGLYENIETLKESSKNDLTVYKYEKSFDTVSSKVEEYMKKCYNHNPQGSTVVVNGVLMTLDRNNPAGYEKKTINNGVGYYVSVTSRYYTLGAEIILLDDKTTELRMFSNNAIWGANFDNINNYVNGKELSCSML